jgi:alkylated DNA repair protein alkB family protein 6
LINEYLPGQGIMPHEDGGAYYPVVATVSLGGTVVLDVTAKSSPASSLSPSSWRILQEPRSLLVTTQGAYTETLHGIAEVHEDVDLGPGTVANWELLGDAEAIRAAGGNNQRTTRISLTYRDVLKVSSLGSKVFGRTR